MEWDARKDAYLAYGGCEGKVRLWGVAERRVLTELDMTKDFPVVLALASSPSDPFLVTSAATRSHSTHDGGRGTLEAWDLTTVRRSLTFTVDSALSQVNSLVFNHNGNMLVTGGGDGMVRIYDMSTKKPIMGWPAHAGQVSAVRLCGDETTVISSGLDGRIVEWSLHRIGRIIRQFSTPTTTPPLPPPPHPPPHSPSPSTAPTWPWMGTTTTSSCPPACRCPPRRQRRMRRPRSCIA